MLQAGLQFRQLSPEDERAAQHRLAEIDLQTAQLNQQMATTAAAFASLGPTLARMSEGVTDLHAVARFASVLRGPSPVPQATRVDKSAPASREVHVSVPITVNAMDADSFQRSTREMARQVASELEYAMQE